MWLFGKRPFHVLDMISASSMSLKLKLIKVTWESNFKTILIKIINEDEKHRKREK